MTSFLYQPTTARALALNAALIVVYMTLYWLVAKRRKRLDTVDVAWGLGFVLLAWVSFIQFPSDRTRVIVTLVTIWGLRLAWHLDSRSRKRSDDPRYAELAKKWKGNFWMRAYISIFLLQGALIWLISLPIVLTGRTVVVASPSYYLAAGIIIWLIGFLTETIADGQLEKFLSQKNRPKVLQTGLWRYSRHPNYFGEILEWWGIGIIALQVSYGWLGLAGPLLLSLLIIFVSGIPPIEKRRSKDPAYRHYQRRTSPLIPWPPKK